jgi:Dyp-type peroxidase family
MTVNLDDPGPIDPQDDAVQRMLENLQGNILKGHGRDHTVHVFIKLNGGDAQSARKRLGALAAGLVTSARQQLRESKQFQDFGIPGSLFGNFFLTARGYRALGFTDAEIEAAFPERPGDFGVLSNFREGMRAHGDELHDPPPADWDPEYREAEIDAMILLADDDEGFLLREARAFVNELAEFSTIITIERGNALRTDSGEGIEHFGYVDGRSQPIYFTTDLVNEGKTDRWNPVEKLKIVLVPDLTVKDDEDAFGSYFVFRKLEQDVRHFKMREQELADELKLKGAERERAGAMAVGRFEDGTPLTLSQTDGFIPPKENNFKYSDPDPNVDDSNGLKCPFHAHIRKSNPRGDTGDETTERSRRITRRGITYGERNRHPDAFQALEDLPTEGVGLLFMCFQSSIANQFAFIQKMWVNGPGFARPQTGIDPVIGQGQAPAQNWPVSWGGSDKKAFDFSGFVRLKGGEFFFAPSIPFLRGLAGGQ